MIEDTIKILDRYGNGLRSGRTSSSGDAERLAKVLRGIASQIDGN
jgi:CspA family cold shock protein